jgi:hypothetical protein
MTKHEVSIFVPNESLSDITCPVYQVNCYLVVKIRYSSNSRPSILFQGQTVKKHINYMAPYFSEMAYA